MNKQQLGFGLSWVALFLGMAGCSSTGQVDLGGSAGQASSSTTSAMTIHAGDAEYSYACEGLGAADGTTGVGPVLDARADSGTCIWPRSKPRLALQVLFSDFLRSAGFPPGNYDLTQATVQKVISVTLELESQDEVPVGKSSPYAVYSTVSIPNRNIDPEEPAWPTASPVSGTLTVAKFQPKSAPEESQVDISLSNVVLPVQKREGKSFPKLVLIESARLVQRTP